jgi:DnaD/phage-associated family protein
MEYTPVPSPFLGALLQSMDDLAELKCALRIFWYLHRKRAAPRCVRLSELKEDPVIAAAGKGLAVVLDGLVQRGVFLAASLEEQDVVLLNTPQNREALERRGGSLLAEVPRGGEIIGPVLEEPSDVFHLYEETFGLLGSALVADELKDLEATYPATWIREAFQEAVRQNKRSLTYIARILERWHQEGRDDGEPGRRPKEIGAKEYLRRYGLPRRA